MNKLEGSNKCVCVVYAYHYRCELLAFVLTFSLLFTLTKRVCQLCRDNCSQIQHILLITLNFLVRLITEYFHLIFSLRTYLD